MSSEGPDAISEPLLSKALSAGADQASVLASSYVERLVRFSNNSITLSSRSSSTGVMLYVAFKRKRLIGAIANLEPATLSAFAERLVSSCSSLPEGEEVPALPAPAPAYPQMSDSDAFVRDEVMELEERAQASIKAALDMKAERVSGAIRTIFEEVHISTSTGVRMDDEGSAALANIRVFKGSASGHGLSCSSTLNEFHPEDAAKTAADYAVKSVNPLAWEEGVYDLVLTPTVAADLFQHVGFAASAFYVESGTSFLADRMNQEVSSQGLVMEDHGVIAGGFGGRRFDDEGTPTRTSRIIDRGLLKSLLHNATTAKKAGGESTGNAGIVAPHPWNLVVEEGSLALEEMIREVRKGIFVTNNWYTRFQDPRSGEYSTVPRDAAFLIENGEIKHPIVGLRISDSIPRQLLNMTVGRGSRWIHWWEVEIPTKCPPVLIRGARVTRASL